MLLSIPVWIVGIVIVDIGVLDFVKGTAGLIFSLIVFGIFINGIAEDSKRKKEADEWDRNNRFSDY